VKSRFVVLTGLSGSGKSQAIRALEDLGYFCVDNLPVALLPMLAELTLRAGNEIARAAVVVDAREGKMLDELPRVLKRLKGSANWLGYLVAAALADRMPVERMPAGVQASAGYRLRLIDATTLSAPGSHGTDWRLHVAYDLEQMRISEVELTDGHGSESLTRFNLQPGDLAIADRGYAKPLDLAEVEAKGADYIVRTGWNATRLRAESGGDFDLLADVSETRSNRRRELLQSFDLQRHRLEDTFVELVGEETMRQ